jgi:hypothetical protein
MKMLRRFQTVALLLIIPSVIYTPDLIAQDVVKRVVFSKGSSEAVLTGRLPRSFADYHAYTLKIRRGQKLTIDLETSEQDAYVAVYETQVLEPDEDAILGNDKHSRSWTGTVPVTSTYSVQVYGSSSVDHSSSAAPYRLTISVN